MDVLSKLEILTDAAKYDAACTSSGSRRGFKQGWIGNTSSSIAGCCHTFSADGRCVTLLKVLMSNCCVYDCAYCVNRRSNDTRRAAFTPEELADLTINFFRRNYIEGLFLSSGVLRNPLTGIFTLRQFPAPPRSWWNSWDCWWTGSAAILNCPPKRDCGHWPPKKPKPRFWPLCGKSRTAGFRTKRNW